MKKLTPDRLRDKMKKTLEPGRYEHTLSVAYTAANLAAVHGADVDKALTAGMLHDCAKCMSHKKQIALCGKYHLSLSETERAKNSPLLHAKAGSLLARELYGVTDEDILHAISYHTTGRPHMSTLEKIVFIADYIESERRHAKKAADGSQAERLTQIRRMAYRDLDGTLCAILKDTLAYLQAKGGDIDPMTQTTYDFYAAHEKETAGEP